MNKAFVPVLLLGSGVALTACGLLFTFVYGPGTPVVFFAVMLAGVIDGVTGLIWAAAKVLWGATGLEKVAAPGGLAEREAAPRPPAERDASIRQTIEREATVARRLLLLTGVLSIVFLGLLAAIAFQMPVILAWLRGGSLGG